MKLTHLDGFLINFVRPPAELLQGPEGILSMYHDNVGAATWRDHLEKGGKKLLKKNVLSYNKIGLKQ